MGVSTVGVQGGGGGSNVLCNVAKVSDFGLHAPVPFVFEQKGVIEEESIPVNRGRKEGAGSEQRTQSRSDT